MTFKKTVDGAVYMFELGYKVFPLKSNDKTPAIEGWQNWAETATLHKIESYATAQPTANWGVYCGASKLVVLDVDNKDTKVGNASLKALIAENSKLSNTLTVITPTKGYHIYFTGEAKSSASKLGKDLDIRGEGGYVVAPGSRIGTSAYEIVEDYPVAPIPEWLSTKLSTLKKDKLQLQDGVLVEEGGRNSALASFGGYMRDGGANEPMIQAALTAMSETVLSSPLPQWEVDTVAHSMMRYAVGNALTALTFAPLSTVTTNKLTPMSKVDPAKTGKTEWVMENRYALGFVTILISRGGTGKSTIVNLEALSIASGLNLSGENVIIPGSVWIYNTEDPVHMLDGKLEATGILHNQSFAKIATTKGNEVFRTSGDEFPFLIAKEVKGIIVVNEDLVNQTIQDIKNHKIKLLIIDPMVETHELDENATSKMSPVMKAFKRICKEAHCAVCLVHHMSKSGAKSLEFDMDDTRGSSAITSAARIVLSFKPMNELESIKYSIQEEERWEYARMDIVKTNLGPQRRTPVWFKRHGIVTYSGGNSAAFKMAELIDRTIEKKDEELEMDRKDLAKALNDLMNPGDMLKLSIVWGQINTNEKWRHIWGGREVKRGCDRFMLLLKGDVRYNGKKFEYVFAKDNPRFSHWVSCEKLNIIEEVITEPMDDIVLVDENDDVSDAIDVGDDYDFLN